MNSKANETMDVEFNPVLQEEIIFENERDKIIDYLTSNNEIFFKNQQIGEESLTRKEKFDIALSIYEKSKSSFLTRFGKYLKQNQLDHFKQFADEDESYEMSLILKQLLDNCAKNEKHIKNRRYEALKQLIKEDVYFSDIEMMKRNPLLYEQLVGQYLTEDEKHERDKYKLDEQATFVKILMEGIERDNAIEAKKKQEILEDRIMENEEDMSDISDMDDRSSSSPEPCTSRWGEFEETQMIKPKPKPVVAITAQERILFKEEFITSMYQSFLDGKDDVDYEAIDNNTSYDDMEQINHDEEDKYFDSEEPEECCVENTREESSEDELDIYMSALNDHPAVKTLSAGIKKL